MSLLMVKSRKHFLVSVILKMTIVAIILYVGFNLRSRLMFQGNFKLQYLLRNQLMAYLEE